MGSGMRGGTQRGGREARSEAVIADNARGYTPHSRYLPGVSKSRFMSTEDVPYIGFADRGD